jgi:hypothetical protein
MNCTMTKRQQAHGPFYTLRLLSPLSASGNLAPGSQLMPETVAGTAQSARRWSATFRALQATARLVLLILDLGPFNNN